MRAPDIAEVYAHMAVSSEAAAQSLGWVVNAAMDAHDALKATIEPLRAGKNQGGE